MACRFRERGKKGSYQGVRSGTPPRHTVDIRLQPLRGQASRLKPLELPPLGGIAKQIR
jgi:hypothetical protein